MPRYDVTNTTTDQHVCLVCPRWCLERHTPKQNTLGTKHTVTNSNQNFCGLSQIAAHIPGVGSRKLSQQGSSFALVLLLLFLAPLNRWHPPRRPRRRPRRRTSRARSTTPRRPSSSCLLRPRPRPPVQVLLVLNPLRRTTRSEDALLSLTLLPSESEEEEEESSRPAATAAVQSTLSSPLWEKEEEEEEEEEEERVPFPMCPVRLRRRRRPPLDEDAVRASTSSLSLRPLTVRRRRPPPPPPLCPPSPPPPPPSQCPPQQSLPAPSCPLLRRTSSPFL